MDFDFYLNIKVWDGRYMLKQIKEVIMYREMLKNLVVKDLRARYKGSFVGFLWTFINPLMMLIVYSIVFSFVMRVNIEHFSVFLFVGLLPWSYFQSSLLLGSACIVNNANLIKKIYFPRIVLPLSVVFSNLINYVLCLSILIPALLIFHIKLTTNLLYFPLILLIQTLLVLSLTLLLAGANVYYRDVEYLAGVILMAWFFLTPIVYSFDMIPENFKDFFGLNPMTPIIGAYHDIFFYGKPPDISILLVLFGIYLVMAVLSFVLFYKMQKNFAEEL